MGLAAGSRLGPYEIQSPIGAGGMGEVYKARDTRLDRSVAIKVLPPEFTADPDRRARFEREAKTIAGLNHPHICTLHDVGEHEGATFLVMEHLAGETLAERLQKGPLPLERALIVATEIADALTAAHRQGVVHRDLKPGNVMLTKAGGVRQGSPQAKLLDFGLAKLTGHGEQAAAASLASVPTRTRPLTSEGAIVGTLQYMAPEQIEGKPADARTDLWALGAILYEMLAGKRAFEGASAASLIGNIMNSEPPALATLHPLTPPALDRLVRWCLAKTPEDRPDTAHDLAAELLWVSQTLTTSGDNPPRRRGRWRRVVFPVALVAATVVATGAAVWRIRETPTAAREVKRLAVRLPEGLEVYRGASSVAISPDGRRVVFIAISNGIRQLYVRPLDRVEVTPLPGTGPTPTTCFFSPDGRAVAFTSTDRVLRRLTFADGLLATVVRDVDSTSIGTWAADGRITFVRGGTLWQVRAEGGAPAQATTLNAASGELSHEWPSAIRDGQVILFAAVTGSGPDQVRIEALSLDTGQRRVLVESGTFPLYASSGHLLFWRGGTLLAAPLDVERLTVTGPAVRVIENLAIDVRGAPLAALSDSGDLVHLAEGTDLNRLVWVSRLGVEEPITATPRDYAFPRLSADGRRVVVAQGGQLWLLDSSRATFTKLRANDPTEVSWPVWSPDGRRVVLKTPVDLRWIETEGGESSHVIPGTLRTDFPSSISPDGDTVAFVRHTADTSGDAYLASLGGKAEPHALLNTPALEGGVQFSPDGRWIAVVSAETGQMEVYLRRFPGPDRRWPVSTRGGTQPRWSRNGHEIVYRNANRMMAVDVSTSPDVKLAQPRLLFEDRYVFGTSMTIPNYDVSRDGQRFVMVKSGPGPGGLNVVLNWLEELKSTVPVPR